ncbi:MAG: DUF1877 family protein [Kofleriaceae bacterium]
MAMATHLQIVSSTELAKLRSQPTWIMELAKRGFSTYYPATINYFLVGDAYPEGSKKLPLAGLLFGFDAVDCETLENGNFGVLEPAEVRLVLTALSSVDLAAVRTAIEGADPDELEEAEVLDYEVLIEDDEEAADIIASEIESLVAFYKRAVRSHGAIVSYTT